MAEYEKERRLNRLLSSRRNFFHFHAGSAAILVAALFLIVSRPGYSGSNLAPAGYPDPQCGEQPQPPKRPEQFRFRAELDAYNKQIAAFNAGEKRFIECIRAYVENAAFDIQAIRRKVDAAVESTRR